MADSESYSDDELSSEGQPADVPAPRISRSRASSIIPVRIHKLHSPQAIINMIAAIIFIVSFGTASLGIPGMRIFEDIICRRYYESVDARFDINGSVDEKLCKIDPVQNELNILLTGLVFGTAFPGICTAIPYGLLADRIGRRPVFMLSLLGSIMGGIWTITVAWFWKTFPLRLIWLAPVFSLIGGGATVSSMMFYAIASDITTESGRANAFFVGVSGMLAADFMAPAAASFLMVRSLWAPVYVGLAIMIAGGLLLFVIPETLNYNSSQTRESISPGSASSWNPSSTENKMSFVAAIRSNFFNSIKDVYNSSRALFTFPILLLLSTFLSYPFMTQSIDIVVRYISKRFNWQLYQAGYLLSCRAFVQFVLLIAILPMFSNFLDNRLKYSSKARDIRLAQISAVLLVLGSLMVALSPDIDLTILGLTIFTLGMGFTIFVRAILTTLVDKPHIGRIFATIGMVETAGAIAASPTLGAMFSLGLKWKGPWLGLPFLVLATICLLSALSLWAFIFVTKTDAGLSFEDQQERESLLGRGSETTEN